MSILEHVSAVPELSQVKFLSKLWDNVILGSLTSLAGRASSLDGDCLLGRIFTNAADHNLLADSEKASRYLKVVQMIQKCPFLPQLSMQTIMDQFGILVSTAPTAASLVIALRALSALPQSAEAVKATNKVLETATGDMLRKSLELIDRAVADAGRDFDHYNVS